MKCRICGCEIGTESVCPICGVRCEPTEVTEPLPKEPIKPSKKKSHKMLWISLAAIILIIAGIALAFLFTPSVEKGTWLDGEYSCPKAGLSITLPDGYLRDAQAEREASEETFVCDAVLRNEDGTAVLYLYRKDLTSRSVLGALCSEKDYLSILLDSYEESEEAVEYRMEQQGEPHTVAIAGNDYLSAEYRGIFSTEDGESGTISERFLVRKIGKTMIFIETASSKNEAALDTMLGSFHSVDQK